MAIRWLGWLTGWAREGPSSHTQTRCIFSVTRGGGVAVTTPIRINNNDNNANLIITEMILPLSGKGW